MLKERIQLNNGKLGYLIGISSDYDMAGVAMDKIGQSPVGIIKLDDGTYSVEKFNQFSSLDSDEHKHTYGVSRRVDNIVIMSPQEMKLMVETVKEKKKSDPDIIMPDGSFLSYQSNGVYYCVHILLGEVLTRKFAKLSDAINWLV